MDRGGSVRGITILVVEDELAIRKLISRYMIREGYEVIEAEDGEVAMDLWQNHEEIDLIILDVMLPKLNGWQVCQKIKEESDVPILLLTACSEEEDRVMGFDLGADQYMAKPFSNKELLARIKNMLKRIKKQSLEDQLEVAGLTINTKARQVFYDSKDLEFSKREYDLLLFFINHQDKVFSRQQILDLVWGKDYEGGERTVDTHVKCLRKKCPSLKEKLRTMRGYGYKLEV